MHGKGSHFKGQSDMLPLLGNDIRRAMEHEGPNVPQCKIMTSVEVWSLWHDECHLRGKEPEYVSIDIEGSDGIPNIVGVSWDGEVTYVMEWDTLCGKLLEDMNRSTPIYHNAAYDVDELGKAGVRFPKVWVDTINTAALMDPALKKGLQPQVLTWVKGSTTWKNLINHEHGPDYVDKKVAAARDLWTTILTRLKRNVPSTGFEWYCFYNALDTAWTYQLLAAHKRALLRQKTQSGFLKTRWDYYTVVMQPLQMSLLNMGLAGLPVNAKRRKYHRTALVRLERMAKKIVGEATREALEKTVARVQADVDRYTDDREEELDKTGLRKYSRAKELGSLRGKLRTAKKSLEEGFNIDSTAQRANLVYGHFGLPEIKRTRKKKGRTVTTITTDEEALTDLLTRMNRTDGEGNPKPTAKPKNGTIAEVSRILRALIAGKKWATWRRSFCESKLNAGTVRRTTKFLPELNEHRDLNWTGAMELAPGYSWIKRPRMPTQYSQHRAKSGRWASGTDNSDDEKTHKVQQLQNVPARLRDMVEADPGMVMVGGDWSAVEWAVAMLKASQVPEIIYEVRDIPVDFHLQLLARQQSGNFDPHTYLASVAFECDEGNVTKRQRKNCKPYTHGRTFLGGARTLARSAGHTIAHAEMVCDKHEVAFRLKYWQQRLINATKKKRYVETDLGWRRYFWELMPRPNEILATEISGNAADMMKWVALEIFRTLPKSWEVLTVTHDSFLMQVPKADGERAMTWLKEKMEMPIEWLGGRTWKADVGTGPTWRSV
jgi:DNA polymerase I-like protein with 3'-5' exonuclease and polymerase domains